MQAKKEVYDTDKCEECVYLYDDNGVDRCKLYDNAIISDTSEKQCKDSMM